MNELAHRVETYLSNILHVDVDVGVWPDQHELAEFLKARYTVYGLRLWSVDCLLLLATAPDTLTPTEIAKHVGLLESQTKRPCIYCSAHITSFNRQRLIEKGVQFVVPQNQMFLPKLGLDLRERFKLPPPTVTETLGPAAQAALIRYLLEPKEEGINPALWSQKLGYTRMTMTRVLNELTGAGLGHVTFTGRERWCHFELPRRALWSRALPLLQTPVRRHFRLPRAKIQDQRGLEAGLTALSRFTMVVEPRTEVRAIAATDAKHLERLLPSIKANDTGSDMLEFEVWKYPPQITTGLHAGQVDPLSLYLSLRDSSDERIEAALEELMDSQSW